MKPIDTILIAGGTGFVGQRLADYLVKKKFTVHVLSRRTGHTDRPGIRYFKWDIEAGYIDPDAFAGVHILINLTGANIQAKRWTKERKRVIVESRTKSLDLLFRYVKENAIPLRSLISSSAVGYYGAVTSEDIFTEASPGGTDFLATACQQWEQAARQFESLGIPTLILRKGVVIGKGGGIYKRLAPLAKWGINTACGNGKQFVPWIDIRDLLEFYGFLITARKFEGVYNAVATQDITMNTFAEELCRSFGKKRILPNIPSAVIKVLLGEMSVMLLKGSRVRNEQLYRTGFGLEFDTIEASLRSL